jgi:hypothetical protein
VRRDRQRLQRRAGLPRGDGRRRRRRGAACADCDDGDAANTPGGGELCDGRDNDCDGQPGADEGDGDGDGSLACADCDDGDDGSYPGASEDCNDGDDNDCDGLLDCADPQCGAAAVCATEDCFNGADDNVDSLVDCDDPDCAAETACASSFTVRVVDELGDVGNNCSLAVDGDGNPHLSYELTDSTADLRYATRSGGTWSTETVDDGIFAGTSSSIEIDGSGRPHIAYHVFGEAWHAELDGAWVLTEVSPFGGDDVDLALDSAGDPHVIHRDGGLLIYNQRAAGVWSANDNIVGSAVGPAHYGQLQLTSADVPQVGFIDTNFFRARFGFLGGTSNDWEFEEVSTDDISGGVSMALDAQDLAHMVYGTLLTDLLRYAQRTGPNTWTRTTIATDIGNFLEVSMALDGDDLPHIAWSAASGAGVGEVHYTTFDGAQWTTEVLDDVGSFGGNPCLALNAAGAPRIGYYDAEVGVLKYAEWSP